MGTNLHFNYTSPFGGFYKNCHFNTNHYLNGNKALQIVDDEGVICTCSVNGLRINDTDEIGIKDWSENEGMVDFLLKNEIIFGEPIDYENSGFVTIPYYKLTDKGMELFN